MKIDWNSKYTTISAYAVIVFCICTLIMLVIVKFASVTAVAAKFLKAIAPIIWGFAIAYLLNPIMVRLEALFKKLIEKKAPHPKLCRTLAVVCSVVIGLGAISALVAIIVPQVLESVQTIFENVPLYMQNIYTWTNSMLENYPDVAAYVNEQYDTIRTTVFNAINNIVPNLTQWASKLKDGAVGVIGGVGNFAIGFIVSVYFLTDKEKFLAQGRKLVTALFPLRTSAHVLDICNKTNRSVMNFLSGKILDSLIIGCICFIAMKIMGLEYALLISTIVGVTNIIPFFGPIIGAVPSALLLLISEPRQTIPFIIMVLLLQQFDGNILGPHILGDSTGLSAFWVMFAIFVGGSMFGFGGMVLGVPLFAVIYELIKDAVESILKSRGLAHETTSYYNSGEYIPDDGKDKKQKTENSVFTDRIKKLKK